MKIKSFDALAPFYDFFMALFRRTVPAKINAWAQPEDTDVILDVGGGTGYNAARIKTSSRRVIVLDISLKMLMRARKHRDLVLVVGDARRLPFKSSRFDLVLAVDSLHHVGDYPAALREIKRVTRRKVFIAEFFGRNAMGKILTGVESLFLSVVYRNPDEFSQEAVREGIPGDYEYINSFEYFFLGKVQTETSDSVSASIRN